MNKAIIKKVVALYLGLAIMMLFSNKVRAEQETSDKKIIHQQVFNQQVFEQLKQKYQGSRWLMLLWSVDCPPCMKELALVKKLQQQKQDLAVVIVNVDSDEESEQQRQAIIKHFELTQLTHLYFRDGFEDHSRYLIDPQWYGELPRSYFIDEAGTFHGKSGLVTKALLDKWLLSSRA
ncbi:TlpA family protein disulfide reductase [Colwellia psychrerythraea]|uniref:Redoxin domain protein n=1 Tax=Colwellia psychrerythraea TaxID=28229 RepID=A0A099KJF6_COLPS|nr:redoxin family protein [Colwellia psychrerythraea]KGJ89713.1 Redoxin domain protein [Colwellia psychrerythraea]